MQILSGEAVCHIYTSQWPVINVKANYFVYIILAFFDENNSN